MIPDSGHSIGGIALPAGTRWKNHYAQSPVGQTVNRALSGGIHVYEANLVQGRLIDCDITLPDSALHIDRYAELFALAQITHATYLFTWRNRDGSTESHDVVFRHSDNPALDFRQAQGPAIPVNSDFLEGTIKLLTV